MPGEQGKGALPAISGERNTCEGNTPAAGGEGGKEKREGWRQSPGRAGRTGERRRVAERAGAAQIADCRFPVSYPVLPVLPPLLPESHPWPNSGGGRPERTPAGLRAPSPLSCALRSAGSGRQRNLRRGGSERCPRPRSVSGSPPASPGAGLSRGCRLRDA